MTRAQRLKRVFGIGVESCRQCGGRSRVITSIGAPAVISVLRLAILFDKVIVIRQLGKIVIYKGTQLFKLPL